MKKIIFGVIGAHVLTVIGLVFHHAFYKEPPKKKIIVHTFQRPPVVQVQKKITPPKKTPPPAKKTSPKKVAKNPPPPPSKKIVKAPPPPPPVVEEVSKDAVAEYGQVLITFFQEALDLPDYGEIKMDLEIDFHGKVVFSKVVDAQSVLNEEFLKKRLPELVCPCFNGSKKTEGNFAFTIVFKNR